MVLHFDNNSCLILIDIQKSYKDVYKFDEFRINIIKLLKKARKEGILICFIYEIDNENSHWLPFWEELSGPRKLDLGIPFDFSRPKEGEFYFIKNGYDAFFETNLNHFLKQNKIDTLYFSGLLTGVCVLNSIFSAFNNGYRIYLLENCCSDRTKKRHDSVLSNYSNYLFIKDKI